MNLEPIDMAIHAAIAAAFTLLLGWFLNPWPFAIIAVLVFTVREGVQQQQKATPPKPAWAMWKWGPRGLAESLVTIPAAFGTAALVEWLA